MDGTYPQRILDLSSACQRRPVVSSINHSRSTTNSRSGSELSYTGNLGNRGSISVSFNSAAYRLPDTRDQLATPVINRVTSEHSSPFFKPFASPQMLPVSGTESIPTIKAATTSSNVRILPTQLRRRRSTRNNEGSSNDALSQYSEWDKYRKSTPQSKNDAPPVALPKRTASIRRNDFTNKAELREIKQKKKFLFHKGFFKRNQSQSSKKRLIRNKAGLNAVLNYIDLPSIKPGDVLSSDPITTYKPQKLLYCYPNIIESCKVPLREYAAMISRENSMQKNLPPASPYSTRMTNHFNTNIKRANSTPPAIRRIRSRSYPPQSRLVHQLWKEYLRLVVLQRVQLRLSLSKVEDSGHSTRIPSPGSPASLANSYSVSSQNQNLMEKQCRKHQLYSISSPADNYSSFSLRTTSGSTISAMRKA